MANWQNPFNLNAPEFVPNFGPPGANNQTSSNGQQPGNQQFNPQQMTMQQQQYYQQQMQFHQQQQQQYIQHQQRFPNQQQFYNNNNNNYQQQQQFNSTNNQYNNNQFNKNAPPHQGGNNKQQAVNHQQKAASVSLPSTGGSVSMPSTKKAGVAEISKNMETLTTTDKKKIVNATTELTKAAVAEPSVEKEKSAAPSVGAIKEDEEWDEGDNDKQKEGAETDTVDTVVAKPKKPKKIVVREYKARKEPINVIFCGHVDAGKSTIGGQIMFLTGMVDKRTLEKYEREAKEKNRESWYLSWALDTNIEEREKGKTVEVGRAFFETEKKHFIILDAPGHKGFVPNMISGASQADIAVLVISARKGEFETGFERGGQTREHAMLVKTAGVRHLIVLINKMDDSTVGWDEGRYNEIVSKLTPYLKKCGFQPGKDASFMPCSGFTGAFIKEPPSESLCSWYKGPCFISQLENLPILNRTIDGPLRMPLLDKYKDMGTIVLGKIESGMVKMNDKLFLMPNKIKAEVTNIYCEDEETDSAICGENVKLKLRGVEEEDVSPGCVLCDVKDHCHVAQTFDAQVVILECPSIICPGFNSIMHIHASTVEVQIKTIIGTVDKKTGEKDFKNRPRFIKQDQIAICRFEVLNGAVICIEPFKLFQQLGRFTLRYESKTVAVGKVLKIIE